MLYSKWLSQSCQAVSEYLNTVYVVAGYFSLLDEVKKCIYIDGYFIGLNFYISDGYLSCMYCSRTEYTRYAWTHVLCDVLWLSTHLESYRQCGRRVST